MHDDSFTIDTLSPTFHLTLSRQ